MAYQDGSIKDGNFKNGRMSYVELITEALNNAPKGELVISDIFKSINLRHPQYKLEDMRWQNSVSGAISRNKNFAKGNKANKYQRYWKFSEADSILAPKVVNELKFKKSNNTKSGNLENVGKDNSNSESDEELSGYEKPSMSYAQLIAEAINNAPEKALVLSDICQVISANYPYYALESQGWQNSIRHNLTLNKNFIKAKKSGLPDKWKLSEDHPFFATRDVKRVYMCSHCDEDFSSIGGLNYHYYAVHEGKLQKNEDSNGALSDKNMSDNTIYENPWLVENIQAFSYLNCPECTFKVKEEKLFQDHAMKYHSLSSVLFGANIATECVYIKTEPNEDFTEYDMVEKELNQDIPEHNMIETEPNEDITEDQMIKTESDEDIMEQHIIKTEVNEDTSESSIIDLLENVVADNKNETVEELPDPDFEKLENTKSPNKNRKSSRSNLEHRFQCPYCESTSSQKYDMKKHVNFMHNDMFHSTDFSQILPIDIQNKAEKSVGIKDEAVNDSFSNKPIKLIYKPSQLKRTIGTVGTNIAIEVPSKVKKDDSNSEPYEDHEELIDPDFEKLENTESPNRNRKSSRSNLEHRFQCPYCDSIFTQKSSLQSHVSLKHEDLFCSTDFSQLLPIDDIKNVAEENIEKKNESSDETFKNKPIKLKKTLGNRFQCPYCTKIIKSNLRSHVNFMHNDQFKGTDFSQILPINAIQNKAEENVEMTQEPLNDSFSNKPIKLTYPHFDKNTSFSKTEKLKRTIGTAGTSIAIEIPSKNLKGDSNLNSADGIKASTSQPNRLKRSIDTSIAIKIPSKMKKGFYRVSPSVDMQGSQSAQTSDQTNVQQTMVKDNSSSEEEEEKVSGHKKPNMSYAQLIAEALQNASEQTLVLSDIYKAINAKHPFYQLEKQAWKNNIRLNLTINKNFIKGERFGYWKLSTDVPKSVLKTKHKSLDYSPNKRTGEKKCEFCKEHFETRLGLIQHIQESHAVESEKSNVEKRYTCNICNVFKAYYMSVIRKHKKGCENLINGLKDQVNGQFKCPHCPYVHEKNYQIKRHIKDMHQDISADYEDTNAKKENKFLVTDESGITVYSCTKCKMKFSCFNAQHIEKCWNDVSN